MSSDEQQPTQQTIVVNSSFIGQVEEFIPGSDWKHYVERVEMFFEVNSVAEDKKVPKILTLMGNKMYHGQKFRTFEPAFHVRVYRLNPGNMAEISHRGRSRNTPDYSELRSSYTIIQQNE